MKRMIAFALATVMSLTLSACGGPEQIDLSAAYDITFSGANDYGKIEIEPNASLLNVVSTKDINKYLSSITAATLIEPDTVSALGLNSLLTYQPAEEYPSLANDEIIVVNVELSETLQETGETLASMQEALNITFTQTEFKVTVEGLTELTPIDIASNVTDCIKLTGANGGATAEIKPKEPKNININDITVRIDTNNYVTVRFPDGDYLMFRLACDYDNNLSNGDTITIYPITHDKEFETPEENTEYIMQKFIDNGYMPELTAEIKCSNLGEYVTDYTTISDANKTAIKADAQTRITEINSQATIEGTYWGTVTEDATGGPNRLAICYTYSTTGIGAKTYHGAIIYDIYTQNNTMKYETDEYISNTVLDAASLLDTVTPAATWTAIEF